MKRIILLAIVLVSAVQISVAQEEVKWVKMENLDELLRTNPKPVFIDAYTDWCGWCKKMDKDTFMNPGIAKYLNELFHPVKFNAESKDPITFLNREFINDGKAGRAHQLAVALLQGQMQYPTVVFLNEKGELLGPLPGYKLPDQLEPYLVFIGEKKYETTKWEDFMKTFQSKL